MGRSAFCKRIKSGNLPDKREITLLRDQSNRVLILLLSKMKRKDLLFILFGVCAVVSASAQNDQTEKDFKVDLNPIVVTGTGTHQRLKNTPAPVSVITANEIKKAGITDFQQAMTMMVPSLSFSTNSMGSYLMMNGLSNKYVLILINGRKVTGDVTNNIDLSRIDMSRVKRIEVLNGAASSLYGSDAIAGVINIITDEPKDILRISSNTRYEKYGQLTQSVNADIAKGIFGSYTAFKHEQSDGWQNSNLEYMQDKKTGNIYTQETVAPMSTGFHSNLVNQKFTLTPTQKLSFYTNGEYYWKLTDRPVIVPSSDGKTDNGGYSYDLHYEGYKFGLGGKYQLNQRSSISLDLMNDNYTQNYKYLVPTDNYAIGDYALTKKQKFYDAELKGIFGLTKNSMTVIGVDVRSESLNRPSALVDKSASTVSAYAQHEIKFLEKFKAIAGIRYDHHENAGGRFSPKVALMYSVGPINLRGTYSTGYRAPGLDELYYYMYKSTTLTFGNKDLKAEHSQYVSFNAEYTNSFLNVSVTGFINNIKDMISAKTTPLKDMENKDQILQEAKEVFNLTTSQLAKISNYKEYQNLNKGLVKGVEINANSNLGYGFSLSGSYTYAYARGKSPEGEWDNIERSIRHSGIINSSYTHDWTKYRLSINANGRFQSRRFHPGHTYGDAPGYGIWNINTIHTFYSLKHFELQPGIGLDNIFNKKDMRPQGVNYALLSPGRMVYVSLAMKFK